MLLDEWTVERFLFQALVEGLTLFLALSLVWHPIGAIRAWVGKMMS